MELKNVQNIIHDNMMSYSNYVITNRALPDIRDGMKPVYRRILTTMNTMKIVNFTKSQNVSGQVMKIHPHGDCYPTIVGMVQEDNNITPFITGKGNFGQHTSRELQAAAPRYTEIKLSEMSKDMLKDIDKCVVNFIPNYDGTIMMPEVLPVKFPSILHYAQSGIAVGMSSTLPSFNLEEINNATIEYLKTGKHSLLIPDFATGGEIIYDENAFNDINKRGTGTIRIRAKAEIIDNTIVVNEIPYTTTRESIIESIIKLIKNKKITEVSDVQDLTGIDGMKIEITAKRNTNMEVLLAKLYRWTPMESTFSANMNVLVNNLPKVMGTEKIIEKWTSWRRSCIKRGIKFELKQLGEKLHRLSGLEKILCNIDKAVEIIRNSKENEIEENLQEYFEIDESQAEYISNIRLRKLNKDVILKQISEIDELRNLMKEKDDCLKSDSKLNAVMISELIQITEKYKKPRRTSLVEPKKIEIPVVEIEKSVPLQNEYKIVVTKSGYIKKLPLDCQFYKIKDDDEVLRIVVANNDTEILVFSGVDVYKVYAANLQMQSQDEFGIYVPTYLNISDFHAIEVISESHKYMLIVYDNMKVAKIDIKGYRTQSRRTKLENSLHSNAKPLQIVAIDNDVDIEVHWKNKVITKNTSEIRVKSSRNAQGVTIKNEKIVIK